MWRRQGIRLTRLVRQYCDNATSKGEKLTPVLTGERGINKVTLLGRAGKDAELRGTEEHPVVLISLATSRSFKTPDGEYRQMTQWHRVAAFQRGLLDYLAATVKKGDRLYVSGSLSYYVSPDASLKLTSIVADEIINLTKRDQGSELPTEEDVEQQVPV